jgi:hypothetical protein
MAVDGRKVKRLCAPSTRVITLPYPPDGGPRTLVTRHCLNHQCPVIVLTPVHGTCRWVAPLTGVRRTEPAREYRAAIRG